MLKRVLSTGIFYLLFYTTFGQTISSERREDMNIKKFHKAVFILNTPKDSVSIPIRSISVIDARSDSSAIGLYQFAKLNPHFIITQGSFRAETEHYINKYVHCSKSDSLSILMVLKQFWISTDVHKFDDNLKWNGQEDTSHVISVSLFADIEFYLYKDSDYYALYKFDSVFTFDIKKAISVAGVSILGSKQLSYMELMTQKVLEIPLSKLAKLDWEKHLSISAKRRFSWNEIEIHEQRN